MTRSLLNGQPVTGALVDSRGLHYGHGVFRTCLIFDGKVLDLEEQTEKAISDAARLGLRVSGRGALIQEARAMAEGRRTGVLKMLLLASGGGRGYRAAEREADRLLCGYDAPSYPASTWEQGIRMFRCELTLAAQPALAGIKHLNRLEQVLATREWEQGCEEGLLCDGEGNPVCGTRSNLFWVATGTLRTPPLDTCGVAGMMRDKVLAAARALGIRVETVPGAWRELEGCPEVFVTNSLIGIWPVRMLAGRTLGAPGPVTRRLMDALNHPRLVVAA